MKEGSVEMVRMDARKGKRKGIWIVSLVVFALLVGGAVVFGSMNGWDPDRMQGVILGGEPEQEEQQDDTGTEQSDTGQEGSGSEQEPVGGTTEPQEDPLEGIGEYVDGRELPVEPTYIDQILLANKKYPLPASFAPEESPEAREAFGKMAAEALLEGIDLDAFSTYRSYERQKELYDRYVKRDGVEAADRYSARPGYSEHQTGLAFDIGEATQPEHYARESFGDTPAGQWLFANAHRFGFILRYPEGKEEITGYMHESWHYRYVGEEVAGSIHSQGITLEEYLLLGKRNEKPAGTEK